MTFSQILFEGTVYHGPSHQGLGRGRVLHVFKDRGEQEEEGLVVVTPRGGPASIS